MYKIIENSRGTRRSFTITCGLTEGYGENAKLHTLDEAVAVTLEWLKAKAAANQPYLTGTVTTGEVVYAWPEGDGKAGGGHEAVAMYTGEVSPLYNGAMTDFEVEEVLNDLASHLGQMFGQSRVYVAYRDEMWILQAEATITPTGETV